MQENISLEMFDLVLKSFVVFKSTESDFAIKCLMTSHVKTFAITYADLSVDRYIKSIQSIQSID